MNNVYFRKNYVFFVVIIVLASLYTVHKFLFEKDLILRLNEDRFLAQENVSLRLKLLELSLSAAQSTELERENKQLKAMLGLKEISTSKLVPGRIVHVSSYDWINRARLNLGVEDKISVGDVVMDSFGNLIGKIDAVNKTDSWCQLISDPEFKIGVETEGQNFLLKGFSDKFAKLLYVPYDANLSNGQNVFLYSHALGISLIKVGQVQNVSKNFDDLTQNIDVALFSNPLRTKYIFVARTGSAKK